ncbi:MAG: hypothetical protein HONBIEJF_02802 [Fimbriimonadaceae bacterium]|nr:hypothetical protein [Fimbriimonadaceae bacterium]
MTFELADKAVILHPSGAAYIPDLRTMAVAVQAEAVGQGGLFSGADSLDLYVKVESLVGELDPEQAIFLVEGDPRLLPVQALQVARAALICCSHPGGRPFGAWDSVIIDNIRFTAKEPDRSCPSIAIGRCCDEGGKLFAVDDLSIRLPFLVGENDAGCDTNLRPIRVAAVASPIHLA